MNSGRKKLKAAPYLYLPRLLLLSGTVPKGICQAALIFSEESQLTQFLIGCPLLISIHTLKDLIKFLKGQVKGHNGNRKLSALSTSTGRKQKDYFKLHVKFE